MIEDERVIALIPARAGSKRLPGKNVRLLGGRPLIAWTIEVALAVAELDRVLVSTDGPEIARAARTAGAEILERPPDLATDAAASMDVVHHAVTTLRERGESARYMVLLQPTSPLRAPADIRACLTLLHDEGLDSVATFRPARTHPQRAFAIERDRPRPLLGADGPWRASTDLEPAYELNGAVYACAIDALAQRPDRLPFGRAAAVVMDSARSVDIDDELDLTLAEALIGRGSTAT